MDSRLAALARLQTASQLGSGPYSGSPAGQQRAIRFTTSPENFGITIVVVSALAVEGIGPAIVTYYVTERFAGGLATDAVAFLTRHR